MRLLKYLQEEGEATTSGATVTTNIAKYEPKLSFLTRRHKKRKEDEDEVK